jgi:hypothetical protein
MKLEIGLAYMDWFNHFTKKKPKTYFVFSLLFIDLVLSIYVYYLLKAVDAVLVRAIISYQPNGSYLFSTIIFYVVSLFFFYFATRYNWTRLFPFLSMAVAVYFPLVVLASFTRIYIGIPEETHLLYFENYCSGDPGLTLCGKAFSHMVFNSSVRALVAVITVPYVYHLAIKYLLERKPNRQVNG